MITDEQLNEMETWTYTGVKNPGLVIRGLIAELRASRSPAPAATVTGELISAAGRVLDDTAGQGLAPGGTSAVRDVHLLALREAYNKIGLPDVPALTDAMRALEALIDKWDKRAKMEDSIARQGSHTSAGIAVGFAECVRDLRSAVAAVREGSEKR